MATKGEFNPAAILQKIRSKSPNRLASTGNGNTVEKDDPPRLPPRGGGGSGNLHGAQNNRLNEGAVNHSAFQKAFSAKLKSQNSRERLRDHQYEIPGTSSLKTKSTLSNQPISSSTSRLLALDNSKKRGSGRSVSPLISHSNSKESLKGYGRGGHQGLFPKETENSNNRVLSPSLLLINNDPNNNAPSLSQKGRSTTPTTYEMQHTYHGKYDENTDISRINHSFQGLLNRPSSNGNLHGNTSNSDHNSALRSNILRKNLSNRQGLSPQKDSQGISITARHGAETAALHDKISDLERKLATITEQSQQKDETITKLTADNQDLQNQLQKTQKQHQESQQKTSVTLQKITLNLEEERGKNSQLIQKIQQLSQALEHHKTITDSHKSHPNDHHSVVEAVRNTSWESPLANMRSQTFDPKHAVKEQWFNDFYRDSGGVLCGELVTERFRCQESGSGGGGRLGDDGQSPEGTVGAQERRTPGFRDVENGFYLDPIYEVDMEGRTGQLPVLKLEMADLLDDLDAKFSA